MGNNIFNEDFRDCIYNQNTNKVKYFQYDNERFIKYL